MQDTIDKILDLTSSLFLEKYNFIEVYPRVSLFKSKSDAHNPYKGLQVFVTGSYEYKGNTVNIDCVVVLTFADETYEELLDRTLLEMTEPREETLKSIENLIIKPSIKKVESI